jgi:hypothetical protein
VRQRHLREEDFRRYAEQVELDLDGFDLELLEHLYLPPIVHQVITSFLLEQAGLERSAADTGSFTLSQRFAGSPI